MSLNKLDQRTYIVATTKPWNVQAFHDFTSNMPGKWVLINSPDQLTTTLINQQRPRYIFFPHWSWKVGAEILDAAECVCFHMTDVPYGRGGSPLQNLIVRGHNDTMLSALRMVNDLDAGPVYLKRNLDLSGAAEIIFKRCAVLVFEMIEHIITHDPAPVPQVGEATLFQRRTPDESLLPLTDDPKKLYDHIRMLDAPDYPKAFVQHGEWRIEFHDAELDTDTGQVTANVVIRKKNDACN